LELRFEPGDEGVWWVRAKQAEDTVECTERFHFRIFSPPPSDFALLEPADGAAIVPGEVTFRWEPSEDPDDAVSYMWWLEARGGICLATDLDSIFHTANLDTLEPGDEAVWWVQACAPPDTVECEQRFHFHVRLGPRPPSAFNLLEPPDESVFNDPDVLDLVWEASHDPNAEDTVTYLLHMDPAWDSTYVIGLTGTRFTFTPREYFYFSSDEICLVEWWVEAVSGGDTVDCNRRFWMSFFANGVNSGELLAPLGFAITSIYPNPFNSRVFIDLCLQQSGPMRLDIVDVCGRVCACVAENAWISPGEHRFLWDAAGMPAGAYQLRLQLGGRLIVKTVVLTQ
jgi:hypothetical protein